MILGDNLASHFSEEVLTKCKDFNITFVCLPSNSTHMCHFFSPLKKYWRDVLTKRKRTDGRLNSAKRTVNIDY